MPILASALAAAAPLTVVAPGLLTMPAISALPDEPPSFLPAGTRMMIEAAIKDGDPKAIDAVLKLARKTSPAGKAEIDAIEIPYRARIARAKNDAEQRRLAQLASSDVFQNWKGQVELGASRTTGSRDSFGLFGSLAAERTGLRWVHKVAARADIQETNEVTTAERVLASWQPNFKVGERFYAFGLTQYEYDPILGYDARYTASGGVGIGLVRSDVLKVEFEGGPAVRHTRDVKGPADTTLSGRGSLNVGWKIAPNLSLSQASSFYYEPGESSANAQTALDTKLIGALKARISYNVVYEEARPKNREAIDTSSRATLIYAF